MVELDIQQFSKGRTKARAYFCYLFSKNIPNRLPSLSVEMILPRLLKIKADLEGCEGVYLLDHRGVQITPTYAKTKIDDDIGKIRANRAYYYRAAKEKRCTITDPYPSLITNDLTVTASQPIFCEDGELKYVACIDMALSEIIQISHQSKLDNISQNLFKTSYALYAFGLAMIALLLFIHGGQVLFSQENIWLLDISKIFESTIMLTLSLAIFDLSKTLIEEEILGHTKDINVSQPNKTMVKFLGSIIIALSIESLMLVFKFAMTDSAKLQYAIYILGGVALLILSLAVYIKFTKEKIEE